MSPAARTDLSDGSTRCVGPTTGVSGSRVFSPSPVLRTTVSFAGSSRPSPTSCRSTATVTPPAVSAKTPVVRARSPMPCTISPPPRQVPDALHDLVVADPAHGAAGAADRVERVRPVRGVADVERLGDAGGLDRLDDVPAVVEGGREGVAAGGLGAEDGPAGVLDDAGGDQLAERLVHLGE